MTDFETRDFSLELPTNGGVSFALIGASRSGKTTFMKHIYGEFFKKHITVMFSMNTHADIYSDLGTKVIVCDTYHPELLKEMHEINACTKNAYPFCVISDDYVDHKIKNDREITRLLTIYRNSGMSSIFSFQNSTLMSAAGRNSCNYIVIFKQQTNAQWEHVLKEFLNMWLPIGMKRDARIAFCKSVTADHGFFFIDNIKGECYISKLKL